MDFSVGRADGDGSSTIGVRPYRVLGAGHKSSRFPCGLFHGDLPYAARWSLHTRVSSDKAAQPGQKRLTRQKWGYRGTGSSYSRHPKLWGFRGSKRQEELHSGLISVLLPKKMELRAAEGKGIGRGLLPSIYNSPGSSGSSPCYRGEDCGSESELTGQVSCNKREAQPGFKAFIFPCNRPPPRRWNGCQPQSTGLLDEKVGRGDQALLCACTQEHQEN